MRRLGAFPIAAAILVLLTIAAHAQGQTPGWYIGLQGGWAHLDSQSNTLGIGGLSVPFSTNYHEGYGAGGVFGYEWRSGLRAEGEVTYRSNGFSNFATPLASGTTATLGNLSSLDLMANLLYDIMPHSRVTPYIGGGVGGADVMLGTISVNGTSRGSPSSWEFAYQGIVGFKYAVNPALTINLDYRYFATANPTFSATSGGPVTLKSGYGTNNVFLGIAWHFPPPPRPPKPAPIVQPPPPPPPLPQVFLVFFDFDKATLTQEALQVIQQVAQVYHQNGSAQIQVTGYTDLVGTQPYNLGLSKRRADAVHSQLVSDGVPDGVIAERWRGMEDPRVPTPPGVREPQNRRVEIFL